MLEPKPISKEAVSGALEKAERYRLLNEPWEAESICRDVLRADPDNQGAIITMLLALTDQFGRRPETGVNQARELLPRLSREYDRAYYAGVIAERWAKAGLRQGLPGNVVYDWLREAMARYEEAEGIHPAENEDAVLRWNACARFIRRHVELKPRDEEGASLLSDHDVPPR